MKRMNKTNRKGFTLLEIMVVVCILCVLAGLSFISVSDAINRSTAMRSAEDSRFVTQVQSQADYIRFSLLSGSARYSA